MAQPRFRWFGTKCRQSHDAATTKVHDDTMRAREEFLATVWREKYRREATTDGVTVHRDGEIRAVRNF